MERTQDGEDDIAIHIHSVTFAVAVLCSSRGGGHASVSPHLYAVGMGIEGDGEFGFAATHHDAESVIGMYGGFILGIIRISLILNHVFEIDHVLV